MEFRHYLSILWRSWPLLLVLPGLVLVLSALLWLRQPTVYAASAQLLVSQTALDQPGNDAADLRLEASWNSTEFIIDDVPAVIGSRMFAEDVSTLLASQGYALDPASIQGTLSASTLHRSVTITASSLQPETTVAILRAAVTALQNNGLRYWDRTELRGNGSGLDVAVLSLPETAAAASGLRDLLFDLGLRSGLALAVAVALAFLRYYLDASLQNARQVEELLQLPVLGLIPPEQR